MSTKLNSQELFHFCEQLSIILRSGIPAVEGLRILSEDSASEKSREILSSLINTLEETGSLSLALRESGLFPDSMTAYVKTGEETGCLDEVMESLSGYYEQEIQVSEQIRSAVAYPLLMLGMMAAVIVLLLVKVLPVFRQVFRQMGLEMNGISNGLLSAGAVISRYSTVFFVLLLLLLGGMLFLAFHPVGRKLLIRAARKAPYIRNIPVSMDYSRLTQSISMGLRSGLSPETCLELTCGLLTHPQVLNQLQNAEALLAEGSGFGEALTGSGLFSGMDARLISIGFHSGSGDEVMKKLSARYREDSLAQISQVLSVVEPTIVITLSVLVGLVLLSVMMPLLGILSEMIV